MVIETPDFVHLHLHTQYSLLDATIRLESLFKRAKEYNMSSVAITDHGALFGVLEFYEYAIKAGVKPIIGCEAYVAPRKISDRSLPDDGNRSSHLVLLAQNNTGYKNLCKLATIAQMEGLYYKPRIDKEVIQKYGEGLIGLSACLAGEIPRLIEAGKHEEADKAALFYQSVFGEGNFYLEVQDNGIPEQNLVNEVLYDMSKRLSIPIVATNDCHYLDKTDVRAHEILLCLQTGNTINDPKRFKFSTDQLFFKSKEEMAASFSKHPEALAKTVDIANRCHIEFDFKINHFPKFDDGSGKKSEEIFDERTRDDYQKRMEYLLSENPNLDREVFFDYALKHFGGSDCVAQITTFEMLKAEEVIQSVGGDLNISLSDVDKISALVPDVLDIQLKQSLEQEPELAELAENKEYKELFSICMDLEGLPSHISDQFSGVVVGDKRLVEYVALYRFKNYRMASQIDIKQLEKIGLFVFRFDEMG